MRFYKVILLVFLFSGFKSFSQTQTDFKTEIQLIHKNIYDIFYDHSTGLFFETNGKNDNPHSYLWPLCALVQAANEMEALEPGKEYLKSVNKAIELYYNGTAPAPGYGSYVTRERPETRYYDDNQWLGLAWMDAYNRTQKQEYLNMSKVIYKFMMTGFDTITGGGIYWREGDKKSKNTCSNGPGILLALQLHIATKEKAYLDTALMIYRWTNKYLLSPGGFYFDALQVHDLKVNRAAYTYNTGTMLQSNVLLYKITKDHKYLDEAERLAQSARTYFYKNGRLPGNYWFNAVLLRGYAELYKVDHQKEHLQFFIDDAVRIWNEERDANNLIGRETNKKLIDQAGMLEIYSRLEQLM